LRFAVVTHTHASPARAEAAEHLRRGYAAIARLEPDFGRRWDPTAKGLYHERLGPAPYSFEVADVHFIGFDPTQALLDVGHRGPRLRWLEHDPGAAARAGSRFQISVMRSPACAL
jgi:hypothetical protein